jgi:histidinol-phosphate phosphatase family protein
VNRQAIILAGGKGTRLKERLGGRPKPLIDVDGTPLLGRQLQLLAGNGFGRVLVLVNHAADQIEAYCAANSFGLDVTTLDDGEPRGTAGAVLAALDQLEERFLVVYGDTLLDIDLDRFWAAHEDGGAEATLFLHPNDHPYDSDLVETDGSGDIVGFHAYPHPDDALLPNLVNAALYVVERAGLERWRSASSPLDFAKDLFPQMLAAGQRLRGYATFEYIKDIGTPARLDKATRHLRSGVVERARLRSRQRAVFLDRDGTLNEDAGYIREHDSLKLIPGVAEAVKRLNDAEYRIVVATNQPVIARGEATYDDLRLIHAKLETELGRKGAFVDTILFCPHHPDGGFPGEVPSLKVRCACRKPGTGLIEEAQSRFNLDLPSSWFIGDTTVDLLAARRKRLRSILVRTGESGLDGRQKVTPDIVADDMPGAVRFILDVYPAIRARLRGFAAGIGPGDLILVGGMSRQGKSTAAHVLAWSLQERGVDAIHLGLDRFLRSADERGDAGVLGRYDLDAAISMVQPWLDRARASVALELPWYDRRKRISHSAVDKITLEHDSTLLLEGVPALAAGFKSTRPIHRLWVEGNEEARRGRLIADLVDRGSSDSEAGLIYERRSQDEDKVVSAFRDSADVTITLDDILGAAKEQT